MEKSITIDIENSNRDDDVTVITNLSSVEASYTVVQGKAPDQHSSALSSSPPAEPAIPHLREILDIPLLPVLLKYLQQTHSTRKRSQRKKK